MTTYTKQQLEEMNFKQKVAQIALQDRSILRRAFTWAHSPQGYSYWFAAQYVRGGPPGWQDEIRAMIAAWDEEETQMIDLTKIDKPFGELDRTTQLALFEHKLDGGEIAVRMTYTWERSDRPRWSPDKVYRAAQPKLIPDSLDWSHVAKEFICCARDESGTPWVYEKRPRKVSGGWSFYGVGDVGLATAFASYKQGNMSWEDSLIWRPGYGPEEV